MRRPNARARTVVRACACLSVTAAMASCGSRTGLFGPEPDLIADAATVDAAGEAAADARVDAPTDARLDATIDALPDAPLPCVPGRFTFALARPQLMFVLDRSGSMAFGLDRNTAPPAGQPTRWSALRDALSQTILPLSNEIAMGARFFPRANPDVFDLAQACGQDPGQGIVPRLGNAPAILSVLTQTSPLGGTPTAAALVRAAQELSSSRALSRVMVLATDGAPNCNGRLDRQTCTCTARDVSTCRTAATGAYNCLDDTATLTALTNIFTVQKIPVYVIGIGAIAPFAPVLDAMAVAGGRPRAVTPRYLPADTPQEMTAAFDTVKNTVARCTYITPSSPNDPDAISVEIAGAPITRDPTHVEGWDWIDKDFGHLQLFGAACAAAGAANVSGEVACRGDD